MKYFWETTGSIKKGVGFTHFDETHLTWIALFLLVTVAVCLIYRRADTSSRRALRLTVGTLILMNEAAKLVMLFATGLFTKNYLPLQLCTINIFIVAIHMLRPSRLLDNFLYAICIPAALSAILLPTWVKLPAANFMHIHSMTIHMLLAIYPIMPVAGGDIKPRLREVGKCVVLLVAMAIPVYFLNLKLGTNYMFLMKHANILPLKLAEELTGEHLFAYPVLLIVIVTIMYLPWELAYKRKKGAT